MSATHGSNGQGPHGMARYGDEWRRVEPVDGTLPIPRDADEFVLLGGGGGGWCGGPDTPVRVDPGGDMIFHIVRDGGSNP
jgi:hypothetical protein